MGDHTVNTTNQSLVEILQKSFLERSSQRPTPHHPHPQEEHREPEAGCAPAISPLTVPSSPIPIDSFNHFHMDPKTLGIAKLDGRNYSRWRKGMQIILMGCGLWPMISQDE